MRVDTVLHWSKLFYPMPERIFSQSESKKSVEYSAECNCSINFYNQILAMHTALTFSSQKQTRYQQKKLFILQKVPDATLHNTIKLHL